MRKLTRFNCILLAMLLLITGVLMAGCGQSSNYAAQNEYITIGCVCPLSGDLARYAEGTLETEEAAVSEINESGGLYIDTLERKLKVRFLVADSKSTEEGAKAAAEQLIQEKNVNLVICSSETSTALGAAAACEAAQIPLFAMHAENSRWLKEGPFEYCFNCANDNLSRIEALAALWTEKGIKKVALLAGDSEDAALFADALKDYCKNNSITLTDPGRVSGTDFSKAAKTAAAANPEALVCYMDSKTFTQAWNAGSFKEVSLKMTALVNETLFPADIQEVGYGGEIGELYTLTGWDRKYPMESSLTEENGTELALWWEERFLSSASELVGFKHAGVELAIDSVKLAMALDAESITSAARSLNVDTVVGLVDYDSSNTCVIPCSVLKWTFDPAAATWSGALESHATLTDVEFDED